MEKISIKINNNKSKLLNFFGNKYFFPELKNVEAFFLFFFQFKKEKVVQQPDTVWTDIHLPVNHAEKNVLQIFKNGTLIYLNHKIHVFVLYVSTKFLHVGKQKKHIDYRYSCTVENVRHLYICF